MSDTLQEEEDQIDQHQSGTCTIPECPCREWSAQITAAEDKRQRREAIKLSQVVARAESARPLTSEYEPAARGGGERDPWKAVHRIKLKHEAVVEAAIVAVNCYEWQGEQQAQFLSEAVRELKNAVITLRPDAPTVTRLASTEHNQHQSLIAERERLRAAIEVAIHNLNAGNDSGFLADYLRLTLDQNRRSE